MAKRERTKEILLVGLLNNVTVTATSQATGISEDTIYKYLRDPEFIKEYDEKRREMLEESCHTLQAKMSMATDELVKIIEDPDTKPQIRLNAIDMLFRHSYRQTEQLEVLSRLDALEEVYRE